MISQWDGEDPTGTFSHPHLPEQVVTARHPETGVVWLMSPRYARQLAVCLLNRYWEAQDA